MANELTFRKSKEKDLPGISEFRKNFFPYNSSIRCYEPEYYRWKCYRNPVQRGEMWLAEDGDIIVGIKNITPKKMKVSGDVVTGAEMGDSFTHPGYQRRGIFTRLSISARESILKKGIGLIYNTPNVETSLPIYMQKLNHSPVPIKLRQLIKPLDMKQLLEARIHVPSPLAALASPFIKVVSNTATSIGTIGGTKRNICISEAFSFPDDINRLSEQLSNSYEIMIVRDKNYLEWRYLHNPDTYSILLAKDRANATLGYMVIKVGAYGSIPVGFIVDFLTPEDDSAIFKKLLLTALKELSKTKVSTVSTWAIKGSFYDKILLRFGFVPHRKITLVCYHNELGSQVVGKDRKWHFTMGDSDTI